jgi:hypothetical protein
MAVQVIDPTKVRPLTGSIVSQMMMGETSYVGRFCYVGSDGKLYECDSTDSAKVTGQLYMIVAGGRNENDGAVSQFEAVSAVSFGRVAINNGTLTPAADYYIADPTTVTGYDGNQSGLIENSAGTVTRRIGAAESADIFFVNGTAETPTS